jgi:DNA-binding NtrC family response regulator
MEFTVYNCKLSADAARSPAGGRQLEIHPKTAARLGINEWLFLDYEDSYELFIECDEPQPAGKIWELLQKHTNLASTRLVEKSVLNGQEAILRFLRIATGIAGAKSAVNLLENLHGAYLKAAENGHVGPILRRLFQMGIWLHEKARQETQFFRFAVDTESVFRELADKILEPLSRSITYIVGYDGVLPGVLEALRSGGCRNFNFFSDEDEPYRKLVKNYSGLIRPVRSFQELFPRVDILLVFTAGDLETLPHLIQERMRERPNAPLLIFNWSNADLQSQQIKKMSNLYFYGRQDIDYVVEYNRAQQKDSVSQVEQWIQKEIENFYDWLAREDRFQFSGIIGSNSQMQRIFELVSRISRTDITVLIEGESGTGKELVAQAIHQLSARADKPFVVVNCAAIPENLLESELFGHVRGAFTGAVTQKKGLFEVANGGTIFLDEIAELPPQLQVKLLRVLQDGEIKRVGGNETLLVNVRVLAATNRDIFSMAQQGQFRGDLYYRINVIQITVPPLQERPEDIPLLAQHFLKKSSAKLRKEVNNISGKAMETIMAYHWPGNVRELENTIEHSVALAVGKSLSVYDLPAALQSYNGKMPRKAPGRLTLKELEKGYIIETLEACDWNYDEASKLLGIGRTTLWRKLREYDVTGP